MTTLPSHDSALSKDHSFLHCPVCQTAYLPDLFTILSITDGGALYFVQCQQCQHSMQGTVVFSEDGTSLVGMLTDFLEDDIINFRDLTPLSSDDVLSFYELWQQ